MGNIIDHVEEIKKLIYKYDESVKVIVSDYRNEQFSICFHKGQDIAKKVVKVANLLGDGNSVIEIKVCS